MEADSTVKKLIVLLMCIPVLVGCAASSLPYQVATQPPEVEEVGICDEPAANEANYASKPDVDEATLENGEEGDIDSYIPYTQTPQQPPDIDRSHQTTPVSPDIFRSKLESLLSSSEYGGIFESLCNNSYVQINIWVVDYVAVNAALLTAHNYFEGREHVPFEVNALEARASLEELEILRAQIREIELGGEVFQFLTPLLEQEQNRLLLHGVVLDESRIRNDVNLLLRANGFAEEIVVFDLHCASEGAIVVPPAR